MDENWPLLKASIAITICLSFGISAMMNMVVVESNKMITPYPGKPAGRASG